VKRGRVAPNGDSFELCGGLHLAPSGHNPSPVPGESAVPTWAPVPDCAPDVASVDLPRVLVGLLPAILVGLRSGWWMVRERLGPEWAVLHAVPVGAGTSDIDHVLIGPAGVFTLNTKNHAGQPVWVAGRTPDVAGEKQRHLYNASHEAGRAAKLLTRSPNGARGGHRRCGRRCPEEHDNAGKALRRRCRGGPAAPAVAERPPDRTHPTPGSGDHRCSTKAWNMAQESPCHSGPGVPAL
jgi:hypothetical protein